MATVSTTTSARSGLVHSAGAIYLETDTNKIIVSDGSAWREWAADGFLHPTQDITVDDLVITYDTLQNCLDTSSPKVGDLFITTVEVSSVKITFTASPVNNQYVYLTDNSGVYVAYKAHTAVADTNWNHDSGNFGDPSWAGSTNLKNAIELSGENHDGLLTAVVSGTNKEIITITHVTPGSEIKALCRLSHAHINSSFGGGMGNTLLVYTAENKFKAFLPNPSAGFADLD